MSKGLLWVAGALPLANVVHALAPGSHHEHEAIAGPIMGTLLTLGAVAAYVGLLRRRPWAPNLAVTVAWATIVGFALFHALPVQTAVTEPYWGDDGMVTGAQAASLVLIGAIAVGVITLACQTRRTWGQRHSSEAMANMA